MLINWTNEEGARFFPSLGSSIVYAGQSTVEEAQAQGGSGASVNFWLALRNSIIIAVAITIGGSASASDR